MLSGDEGLYTNTQTHQQSIGMHMCQIQYSQLFPLNACLATESYDPASTRYVLHSCLCYELPTIRFFVVLHIAVWTLVDQLCKL